MLANRLEILSPCKSCTEPTTLPFDFTMAFQPIVNVEKGLVFAYESLVRGTDGRGAGAILSQVTTENRYTFDQSCRVKSVQLAAKLGIPCSISINFMPNAVYKAETCIRTTLRAAKMCDVPVDRIIFEITENERVVDKEHLKSIMTEYKRHGFKTAIDDFGAGYSGLQFLTEFQPDIIKLDMMLLRDIDQDRVKRSVVNGILGVARELEIQVIAEGVETMPELDYLRSIGISLFQGYLFAKPQVEALPSIDWQKFMPETCSLRS